MTSVILQSLIQFYQWTITCNDVAAEGRVAADDLVLVGPRGIGKTSTVEALGERASEHGFEVLSLQAVRGESGLIGSLVETAAQRIADPVSPSRDPRTVAEALATLADALRTESGRGGLMISVDELQVAGDDLPLLAAALHRLNTQHPQARVLFAGTGLPNTQHAMAKAGVTHPDRLFNITPIPARLTEAEARYALTAPAATRQVTWAPAAQDLVVEVTGGYPAHLQAFAHRVWQAAEGTIITEQAAKAGIARAGRDFERRTMAPHWAELSGRQREYLTAVSVAGGVTTSSRTSALLGRTTRQDSMTRASLIASGDLYSPGLNQIALSMPLTGRYALARHDETRDLDTSSVAQMRARLQELEA